MAWTLFRNADLEAAVSLFPQFLADAIERRFHPSITDVMVAAIDMQTPGGYDLYSQGCTMLINITGSAVFRLARDLLMFMLSRMLSESILHTAVVLSFDQNRPSSLRAVVSMLFPPFLARRHPGPFRVVALSKRICAAGIARR
jgi:hypothetical protein